MGVNKMGLTSSESSVMKTYESVTSDEEEIRMAERTVKRIRQFRENQISKIFANETPVPFYDTAKIVIHLIPVNHAQIYEISQIASHSNEMKPINCSRYNNKYNFDGFLTYSGNQDVISHSYVQFFKNGIIEAVEGLLLKPRNDGKLLIPSIAYEEELIKSLYDYLSILKKLNVELPVFIFLTLVGVQGYSMAVDKMSFSINEVHTIDRDNLLLPEIVIESYDIIAKDILRPCFDSIWNACGFPKSLNYADTVE